MIRFSSFSRLALAAVVLSGFAGSAMAQEEPDDRKVVYKKKTEIDFEGLDVSGELVKPSGALLLDRKRASFNPLINIRKDFNAEMSASVDEIK
jgi:hypothetical protein